MATITVDDLTLMFFNVNSAMDQGQSADIDEARAAMAEGEIVEFVAERKDTMMTMENWPAEKRAAIGELFAETHVEEERRLSVADEGLAYVAANIVEVLQNRTFRDPATGEEFKPGDLTVVEDW
jgi:hypothetical protein